MFLNKIADEYQFSDFTLGNYSFLLKFAMKNYSFVFFEDNIPTKSIILRHDIDVSIEHAFKMAKIEESLGVCATYFVQLHSRFYNTVDAKNYILIKDLLKMGHKVGLHFDTHFWGVDNERLLEHYLTQDKKMFENIFEINLDAFSFHNNDEFTLRCEREKIAGLINVYSKYFKGQISYCSDSLGYWRYDRLEDILKKSNVNDRIQILIHPCWWHKEVLAPRQRIMKIITENNNDLKKLWDDSLKKVGAKNIDREEIL